MYFTYRDMIPLESKPKNVEDPWYEGKDVGAAAININTIERMTAKSIIARN